MINSWSNWLVLTRVDSCWFVLDSCWFVLILVGLVLIHVDLCLARVDSCRTRVHSCWLVSGSCWLVLDSCWFMLTGVDSCWLELVSCIRIDLTPIMTTIPSMRFSKTNWLNFHCHHCSSLITNRFNTIIMGDSITAGLNRYGSVCSKYLEPLKTLNCGIRGDRVHNVLWWVQNLPVISSLKKCRYFMWDK